MPESIVNCCVTFSSRLSVVLLCCFILGSCQRQKKPRFERLSSEQTGIDFENRIESMPEFNMLNYLYFYDGGGVSIGDINNDSLPDIYFTANMLPNKLYLNEGGFSFEDITEAAGVGGSSDWATGTTMADVNGDGLLDIYVSSVNYLTQKGRNELFINNGDQTFTEEAKQYGLDLKGYSKQASFFDYDNDGDLDVYLVNHAVHSRETFRKAEKRTTYSEEAGDKLLRNNNGFFEEVTKEAGIYSSPIGFGLAATVSDINDDGYQDIYVSNDFHEQDYLYMNNGDGSFREVLEEAMGHSSRASMGNDIADFNNDGLPDIFVLDMLPGSERERQLSVSAEPYEVYEVQRDFGYHPQLIRNTLQLNMGLDESGDPLFSEIGQLVGVHATDWSWSTLFFDMDNDTKKDIFVTNGIFRRPNDLDYLALVRTDRAQQTLQRGMSDTSMSLIKKMPHTKVPNAGFINRGELQFSNQNAALGFEDPTYSSGAAYGDLDNDGDWDLVINNVNSAPDIYRNTTRDREQEEDEDGNAEREINSGNYIKLKLQGSGQNTFGIGSKVEIYAAGRRQRYELMPTRGFQSSVEPLIIAGIDSAETIDSLVIRWPDQRRQVLKNVSANQTLSVEQEAADPQPTFSVQKEASNPLFEEVTAQYDSLFHHRENTFVDYKKQQLIPHMLSTQGPRIAVGDVNGDGLDDFYIGGAKYQAGSLLVQDASDSFEISNENIFERDRNFEDTGTVFFDANGDGAPDLYVASGGNEFPYQSDVYRDRLYINDGEGNYAWSRDALPAMRENGGVAAAADYDGDGDQDLFVGNRSIPGNYGFAPRSFLLENDGSGQFSDITDEAAEGLRRVGMVTDATWKDLNGDGAPDLIIAGEWMPITIFMNEDGTLVNKTAERGLAESSGWWNRLEVNDFDGDGDTDILAGNVGLNSDLQATEEAPLSLYLKDFNNNGQLDPVMTRTVDGKQYPVARRDELLYQFGFLRSKFPIYDDFAGKTVQQILGKTMEDSVLVKSVNMLESVLLQNNGAGGFQIKPLPLEAQFAPIFAFQAKDFNGDGVLDVLTGGNYFEVKPSLGGRYDASYGWFLKGDNEKPFRVQNFEQSGFFARGQIRDIKMLTTTDESELILVARNNEPLLVFKVRQQ
jgi:hypothetical protein